MAMLPSYPYIHDRYRYVTDTMRVVPVNSKSRCLMLIHVSLLVKRKIEREEWKKRQRERKINGKRKIRVQSRL